MKEKIEELAETTSIIRKAFDLTVYDGGMTANEALDYYFSLERAVYVFLNAYYDASHDEYEYQPTEAELTAPATATTDLF